MGEEVEAQTFSRTDRLNYREKLRRCLDVFGRMLNESKFDFEHPLTGTEIEFNLVDAEHDPAMRNKEVLAAIADEVFQAEMGQFNIEMNVRPTSLAGTAAAAPEGELRASLDEAEERARGVGAHHGMVGPPPPPMPRHATPAAAPPPP